MAGARHQTACAVAELARRPVFRAPTSVGPVQAKQIDQEELAVPRQPVDVEGIVQATVCRPLLARIIEIPHLLRPEEGARGKISPPGTPVPGVTVPAGPAPAPGGGHPENTALAASDKGAVLPRSRRRARRNSRPPARRIIHARADENSKGGTRRPTSVSARPRRVRRRGEACAPPRR